MKDLLTHTYQYSISGVGVYEDDVLCKCINVEMDVAMKTKQTAIQTLIQVKHRTLVITHMADIRMFACMYTIYAKQIYILAYI